MAIAMNCPHCDRTYTLEDHLAGAKVRCKACSTVFEVPAPGERRRDVASDAPRRPSRRDDYDDRDDYGEERRPRRKGRKRGVPVWVWLVSVGGGLLVVGLVVLVVVLVGKGPSASGPGFGGLSGTSKVTKENADKLLAGMSVAEAEELLGPGKVCTYEEICKVCEAAGTTEAGFKKVPLVQPPGRAGDESSWHLWQNGDLNVLVIFRKGKSGVERVSNVSRWTRLPGGAVETASMAGGLGDLDALAAKRLQEQQLLKDPRWKTGPAIRTALVGKWRSPKGPVVRQGWDFNADGTCILYRGGGFGAFQDTFNVDRRGQYRFLDDSHVEMVTTSPYPGFPGQPPEEVTQRYKVLVDEKELIFVDEGGYPPSVHPALQRQP
jgi:predicted Zn finger-like uncharacterized protein